MNKQKKHAKKAVIIEKKENPKNQVPSSLKEKEKKEKKDKPVKEEIPQKTQKKEEKPPQKQGNISPKKEKKPLNIKEPPTKELNKLTDPGKAVIPCKAKIENFPSRNELLQFLSDFIEKNQLDDKCCRTSNGDNIITVSFKDSNICFDFVKELNILKLTNSLYSKIRTNIVFDFKTPKTERKPKNTISTENPNVNSVNGIKRKAKVYISAHTPILISEPFVDPAKLQYQEYIKGKAKWINPKGFRVQGNAEKNIIMSEIGTYVLRTPAKYNFNNFKFRDDNKEKWINKDGFRFKRPPEEL